MAEESESGQIKRMRERESVSEKEKENAKNWEREKVKVSMYFEGRETELKKIDREQI